MGVVVSPRPRCLPLPCCSCPVTTSRGLLQHRQPLSYAAILQRGKKNFSRKRQQERGPRGGGLRHALHRSSKTPRSSPRSQPTRTRNGGGRGNRAQGPGAQHRPWPASPTFLHDCTCSQPHEGVNCRCPRVVTRGRGRGRGHGPAVVRRQLSFRA